MKISVTGLEFQVRIAGSMPEILKSRPKKYYWQEACFQQMQILTKTIQNKKIRKYLIYIFPQQKGWSFCNLGYTLIQYAVQQGFPTFH